MKSEEGPVGVYIGRFCPMHRGHQQQISWLLDRYEDRHLILIGSCNAPQSLRNLFTYKDRKEFIHSVFPQAKIGPLPDFDTDEAWLQAVDDLAILAGYSPEELTFLGGCAEDVAVYAAAGCGTFIRSRFGEGPKTSATEVRDALIEKRSLAGMVDSHLEELITERFHKRWDTLRKR